jgi:hypothetical protein
MYEYVGLLRPQAKALLGLASSARSKRTMASSNS